MNEEIIKSTRKIMSLEIQVEILKKKRQEYIITEEIILEILEELTK